MAQEWAFVRNDGAAPVAFTSPRLAQRGGYSPVAPGGLAKMTTTRQTIEPGQAIKIPWDVYIESVYRPLYGQVTVITEDDFETALEEWLKGDKAKIADLEKQIAELKKTPAKAVSK